MTKVGNALWNILDAPRAQLWNGMDFQEQDLRGADGAYSDNYAVFPALRRSVKKLLVCAAAASDLGCVTPV